MTSTDRMNVLLSTLNRFKGASVRNREALEQWHVAEEDRLSTAEQSTSNPTVRAALQASRTGNQAMLMQSQDVYKDIVNFSDSMANLLSGSNKRKTSACDSLNCGLHSTCSDTTEGAQCVCNEGFVGAGEDCHPPPEFRPHRIIIEGQVEAPTSAYDMGVCAFGNNMIAIVFRDASKGDIGRMVVGTVRDGGLADLSPPEQFTPPEGKAFNPVVQGSPENHILVAWRDEDRGGVGWMRGAVVGVTGIRGADMALTWGAPVNFAHNQAHKMALVGFGGNHFALMYSEKVTVHQDSADHHAQEDSFGNALLAEVAQSGAVTSVVTARFTDSAVTRLDAVKITNASFILAARASPLVDDLDPSKVTKQEAIAFFGEVVGRDLVFNPNPLNLAGNLTHIWGRGVSLVSPNTFAYAFQEGLEKKMKMAVVHVHPETHVMEVVQSPLVVRSGMSPYVSMVSLPYTSTDPHTMIYYGRGNSSFVNVCSWTPKDQILDQCEDFLWLSARLRSVAGVRLGGGKLLMAFATETGTPYYTVFGISKKHQH
jgi:hypothetical protein